MGNHNSKGNENSLYSQDELKVLGNTFHHISGGRSDDLSHDKLLACWNNDHIIDSHLAESCINYLYNSGKQDVAVISFNRFAEPYYIVQYGSPDEKAKLLAESINSDSTNQILIRELENFVISLVRSYLNILIHRSDKALMSWYNNGYTFSERSIHVFSKAQVCSLTKDPSVRIDISELKRWLQRNAAILIIWNEVFRYLYSTHSGRTHKLGRALGKDIFPHCEGIPLGCNYLPLLEVPHIIFVNNNLPNEYRHKWRFLFSSQIHGQSFSTMLDKITYKGPTFLVIEDEDHFIFGGYAPKSWALSPKFSGDDSSMLFTISPAMRCFNTSGYNNHYQYMNLNQQTMPNGLGMGGQLNYWALWIDSDYGIGQSSESCTTYRDYVQLSKRKDFKIKNIEVWGIGDLPKDSDDLSEPNYAQKPSILDKNLEDKVMLELSGKEVYSEGLRDPELNYD